jgi:hypothetical protein
MYWHKESPDSFTELTAAAADIVIKFSAFGTGSRFLAAKFGVPSLCCWLNWILRP